MNPAPRPSNMTDRCRHFAVIIAVVNGLGTNLNTKFTSINDSLK
jgi:hypothetical protein